MKKFIFLSLTVFATLSSASQSLSEWAKSDNEKASASLLKTRSDIESKRNAIDACIIAEREKYAENLAKISLLKSSQNKSPATFEKSKYFDSIGNEIYSDAVAFAGANLEFQLPQKNNASLDEAYVAVQKVLSAAAVNLENPLQMRSTSAVSIKDKVNISGKKFALGNNSYFISDTRCGFLSADGLLYGEEFGKQIKDFSESKTDEIPFDTSNGILLQTQKSARTIAAEISLGGVWIYPILLFGGLSFCVCILKIFSYSRIRRASPLLTNVVCSAVEQAKIEEALAVAKNAGYPYSKLLADLIAARNLPPSKLEEISYESMLSAGEKLFSGLSILSVTAAVSPLFGLLGTVTGIIKTFGDLSFQGAQQAQFISAGISEALITTEYGLVVAIPAFVAHAIFSRRAKAILADMEKIASSFLGRNNV